MRMNRLPSEVRLVDGKEWESFYSYDYSESLEMKGKLCTWMPTTRLHTDYCLVEF